MNNIGPVCYGLLDNYAQIYGHPAYKVSIFSDPFVISYLVKVSGYYCTNKG